jgi:hypothetical protein
MQLERSLFQSWSTTKIYGLLAIEHWLIGLFFMVNDHVVVNICNPQMMCCFVCCPTQLEPLDAQGKHKGLGNYDKNQGTSALKKYACHEHSYLYKK